MSQLVRMADHGIMTSAVEQALNRTQFSEEQLSDLQQYLSSVLPPYAEHSMMAQGLIGERAMYTELPSDVAGLDYGANSARMPHMQGFYSTTRVVGIRSVGEMIANTSNEPTPLLVAVSESYNPQFVLAKILMPSLDRAREAEWRCRVSLDMATTACAVERFRLALGALPPTLEELVPTLLQSVPTDPFRPDGGPITYLVNEDGSYQLYSWAQNRKDDGGIPRNREKYRGSDWKDGDWMFNVAPLEFRNGPQFIDVPPVEEGWRGLQPR